MKVKPAMRWPKWDDLTIVVLGVILALLVRFALRHFVSDDYTNYTGKWYALIKTQGAGAFGSNLFNYTPLYLYCLYLVSVILPQISGVVATKLPSIAADFVCAGFVYQIVSLQYPRDRPWALFSFLAVLFAPTVILNSSFWGQADSLYTAALLAGIFWVVTRREPFAFAAFGLAFAFKLQAIFLAPFLAVLVLKRTVHWKWFGLIPLVYLLAILPAWLAGRPLPELMTIYSAQVDQYTALTMNAPTLFAWFPEDLYPIIYPAGLIGAVIIGYLFVVSVYKSRAELTAPVLVQLALVSVMITPYFLPKMHERYFFPADVLSIVFGFYYPQYFFVPLLVSLVSFFSYQPFLLHIATVPFPFLALVQLFVIVVIVRHLLITLYPPSP